jgi:hypothetical protein
LKNIEIRTKRAFHKEETKAIAVKEGVIEEVTLVEEIRKEKKEKTKLKTKTYF